MAKKIHVSDCSPGRFYILSEQDKLFFCIWADPKEGHAEFQQVGSDFRVGVFDEKVKPVQVFAFSK